MKGTHQGHNWNKPLRWDGRSDFMDAKRLKRLKKRKYRKQTAHHERTSNVGIPIATPGSMIDGTQ